MATQAKTALDCARDAGAAALAMAAASRAERDAVLERLAELVGERSEEIAAANERDLEAARAAGLEAALLDRLALDEARIQAMVDGVREVAKLSDPIGEELDHRRLDNGLDLRKVRVPLGVVAIVYEARPNVTIDAAALAIKSANACVLRGSSNAARTNTVLASLTREALAEQGLPEAGVEPVMGGDRAELEQLATADGLIDLIIPRGGEGLKAALQAVATVPVIYAAAGNCHVYVDESADDDMAARIVLNAKTQRPGVCNAAETLLVHEEAAERMLEALATRLSAAGVSLVGDDRSRELSGAIEVGTADEDDWLTEYHALRLAMRVVGSVEEAIEHINRYGTGHSDAIVTRDDSAAEAFTRDVDSACVYVNASTRFTDGFEFGMGAEMGNSTQKLHARGPIGLRELTTYKYVIHGDGQTRG